MSNPTTPFSWQMPQNTDLVTDLPADFEVFGQAVATSMQDLLGGTTGQVLAKASNADMDFVWSADAAGMTNPMTTTGDIIYSSPGSTPVRLGIGTTGEVLKVAGGVPTWATGGAGNLTETVFTSSNATYTIPTGVTGIWALCVGSGGGGGASSTATAANAGGCGGAGQIKEFFINISGDTTLNITVPAGGAGGTAGGKGSSGSAATIVGNQSSTTYATVAGGGGGGGGAAANVTGISGASGGGNGFTTNDTGGGGGGMGSASNNAPNGMLGGNPSVVGGGATATTMGVTGYDGGVNNTSIYGGQGINIWGRSIGAGGNSRDSAIAGIQMNFGAGANTTVPSAGSSATANTGAGGNNGKTSVTTALAGGAGGSGLVVLRYVV